MMHPEQAVIAAMLICFSGAALALAASRRRILAGWLAFVAIALSSALILPAVARVLRSGPGEAVTFLTVPSMGFALRIYVDGLSAVFLGLIAVVVVPVSFYSIEYMRHHQEHGVGRYYPNLLLFVAAMYGLVSTTDMMWFFFIFWQMMTWAGWALIRFERRRPQNRWAATKYVCMMQLACGATMLGAGMLAGQEVRAADGTTLLAYDFDAVSAHLPEMLRAHPGWVAMAFLLFLVGFGIKLGVWPFGQLWLPDAHPAAPSPVSALLSGVMIKTGVYGLMRYFIWLVPVEARAEYPAVTWGLALAVLGTITLFTGTVNALKQEQSKRLLAFSSIGQGGYILLGLGTSVALLSSGDGSGIALATAAFCGALFHTLNHAVFKSLLFLNAGAVVHATGTQDLNKLGGLMRYMPVTGVAALVGAMSIAGVPLLSGFASKRSLCLAAIEAGPTARILPVCAAVAILTSTVTLALFMKFVGVIFLSRTSALVAEHVGRRPTLEVGWMMKVPQLVLAGLCILCGLAPLLLVSQIHAALSASRQGLGVLLADAVPATGPFALWGLEQGSVVYIPLVLAAIQGILFLAVRYVGRAGGAQRRVAVPWLCGYARETDAHRYRASGFYVEFKRYFGWMGGKPQS